MNFGGNRCIVVFKQGDVDDGKNQRSWVLGSDGTFSNSSLALTQIGNKQKKSKSQWCRGIVWSNG